MQYPDPGSRWNVELCLTLPHETNRRLERIDKLDTGVGAMMVQAEKIFYVVGFITTVNRCLTGALCHVIREDEIYCYCHVLCVIGVKRLGFVASACQLLCIMWL